MGRPAHLCRPPYRRVQTTPTQRRDERSALARLVYFFVTGSEWVVRAHTLDLADATPQERPGRTRRRRRDPAMRLLAPQLVLEQMLAVSCAPVAPPLEETHGVSVERRARA